MCRQPAFRSWFLLFRELATAKEDAGAAAATDKIHGAEQPPFIEERRLNDAGADDCEGKLDTHFPPCDQVAGSFVEHPASEARAVADPDAPARTLELEDLGEVLELEIVDLDSGVDDDRCQLHVAGAPVRRLSRLRFDGWSVRLIGFRNELQLRLQPAQGVFLHLLDDVLTRRDDLRWSIQHEILRVRGV